MSEFITKDDAKALIKLIEKYQYTVQEARVYISIMDRLNKYIVAPDKEDKK